MSLLCPWGFALKRKFVSKENLDHQENFLLNSKKLYVMKRYLSIKLAAFMENESLTGFFTITIATRAKMNLSAIILQTDAAFAWWPLLFLNLNQMRLSVSFVDNVENFNLL